MFRKDPWLSCISFVRRCDFAYDAMCEEECVRPGSRSRVGVAVGVVSRFESCWIWSGGCASIVGLCLRAMLCAFHVS